MSFQFPFLLWLLLIPLVALIWEVKRRARHGVTSRPKILRAEAAPGRLEMTTGRATARAARPVRWRLWLGVALLGIALARPQWGQVEEQVFDQAREILIAVDLSRSMLAPDVPPSRLDRAKLLITSLLERLEGERVGLIVFAGTGFLQSPLSADYEILREFLPSLDPTFLPEGGTNYEALLQTALDAFGESGGADRFLIILSDGESQTETWRPLVPALNERGVTVLGLGVGTAEGAMLPDGQGGFVKDDRGAVVLSRLQPDTLQELAQQTNGVYEDASRWVDLAELLRETVEAGRAGEFTEVSQIRRVERFQWALAPAFLLLAWSFWREFAVHPRARAATLTISRRSPAAAVATGLILLLTGGEPAAAASPEAGDPFAAPLTELVGQLVTKSTVGARDYGDLAQATITYGQRRLSSQQAPEPGVIRDGLAAVASGEALDARAADWAKLRAELEALRPPEPPPEQQSQDDSDQENQEEQQSQDSDQQSQQQKGSPQDQSQPDESSQDPSQQEGGENNPPDPSSQSKESPPQDPPPPGSSDPKSSAFGDMDEPPREPDNPRPQETQQVGGQSERPPRNEERPELTVPLQKLEQLKQQDSPAKLHQLMQDPNARPTTKGRDW